MILERLSWRRDMSERCEFLVFHSCQKGVLWAHKAVDLAPHPVVALVYQVGNAEKFPRALGFESLDPFLRVSKQESMYHSQREG